MIRSIFRPNIAVGFLFLGSLGILGYATIFQQKEYELQVPLHLPVRLATAEGLRAGAVVQIQGVEVGLLRSLHYILLDATGRPIPKGSDQQPADQMVLAILDIQQAVSFYPNYQILTRYPAALSAKIFEIDPGGAVLQEHLKPMDPLFLSSTALLAFQRTGQLPKGSLLAAGNHDDPLYLIAQVISENRRGIRRIVANFEQATHKINTGQGTVALLINQSNLLDGLNAVLEETDLTIEDVRAGVESLRETDSMLNGTSTVLSAILTVLLTGSL